VNAAAEAAAAAFPAWSHAPAATRGATLAKAADALDRRVEQIAQDMTLEMGKPIREARMEAARMALILRYFAGEGLRASGERYEQAVTGSVVYTERRPLGVVALITPWNFPAAIPAWKSAPALAYGNTVVMKVAQDAPLTGLHLAASFEEAGLPSGVFNVVIGRGSDVGTPLVRHPLVKAVSFTGSVAVGTQIREEATKLGKRVQLELGGQNPLVVMTDADLDRAAEAAYAGAFWSAGQKCTATRRIYVQDDVYEDFKRRLLARIESGVVGDPAEAETEVGPIVNEAQLEEVRAGIERGTADGGTLLAGGERLDDEAYLLAPTLFEGLADDAFLSCEEVFGPVTTLYRFSDLDEALRRANAVEYGLSASIFTSSLAAARTFANEIEAGIIRINGQTAGADVHVPFGGIKGSGFGPHEQGRAAREFYTELVTVYEDV
jgi:alpha-ketoglutaric semialdehyde dehydrogenase